VLPDIDRPEDLPAWEAATGQRVGAPADPLISVVVPTLNEEEHLPAALERVRYGDGVEAIVADGGSTDGTHSVAEACGARVVTASGGRGVQLNTGARDAAGEILLFLHADTLLPMGFGNRIRRAIARRPDSLGAFRFAVDNPAPRFRWLAQLVNLRVRLFGLPYGDQALFCRKERFQALGGFRPLPIMEDFELVRRWRRAGGVALLQVAVTTSDRRWRGRSITWLAAINAVIVAGYALGIPPERLARLYRGKRPRGRRHEEAPG
jgi:rSAM/selenodomain-associated transferase 2